MFMKNYEEMTQSVLQRAKEFREKQKKRNRNIITAVTVCSCCICMAVIIGIKFGRPELPGDTVKEQYDENTGLNQSTASDTSKEEQTTGKPRMVLLHAMGEEKQEMERDVKLPYQYKIHIQDITGKTEQQMTEVWAERDAFVNGITEQYPDEENIMWGGYRPGNALITHVSIGTFVMKIEEINTVESISASCSDSTKMFTQSELDGTRLHAFCGRPMLIEGENLRTVFSENDGGFVFWWMIGDPIVVAINENPAMPLSAFYDTITFMVKYKDGSEESCLVDMYFSDNGEVYAIYRGVEVNA